MARSFNDCTIVGHLGSDPEVRTTEGGESVASFSVATSSRSKGQDQTTWWRASAFGKLAQTCAEYLHKGSYVYIRGSVTLRSYNDKSGNERQSLDIAVREMNMLDKASDNPARGGGSAGEPFETLSDPIPF